MDPPKESQRDEDWLELGPAAVRLGVPKDLPSPLSADTLMHHITVGDHLADAALKDLSMQRGGSLPADPLAELVRSMSATTGMAFPTSASIVGNSEARPGAPGRLSPAQQMFWDQVSSRPEWIDEDKIKEGQLALWRHAGAVQLALIFSSLAGGFAVPRINNVLVSTGYLASPKRVYQRLLETNQMVLDIFTPGEGLVVGSRSWKSVVRVRLLHASVRMRQSRAKASGKCPASVELAVNQTDMLGTILAFQCLAAIGLSRVGIFLTPRELDAYTHLWRAVSFYIGVIDNVNPCQFGFDASIPLLREYARLYFHPDVSGSQLAVGLLQGISLHSPLPVPLPLSVAFARTLIPEKLSNALEIPEASAFWRALVQLVFFVIRMADVVAYLPGYLGTLITNSRHQLLGYFMKSQVGRATFSVSRSMRRSFSMSPSMRRTFGISPSMARKYD